MILDKRFLVVSIASIVLFVCLSSFVDKGRPASNSDIKQANIEALTGVSANTGRYESYLERRVPEVSVTVELSDGRMYRCKATRIVVVECEGKGNFSCTLGEVRYENLHDCGSIYSVR